MSIDEYRPLFTQSGQYIGMGVPADDVTAPAQKWAPEGATFALLQFGDTPPDGTIDGSGVWRGGFWHPNRPEPLDAWLDMDLAPKDGSRILALVPEGQFYRHSDTPNELWPVVVRWQGEHELWGMPGIGGLQPRLWHPIPSWEYK